MTSPGLESIPEVLGDGLIARIRMTTLLLLLFVGFFNTPDLDRRIVMLNGAKYFHYISIQQWKIIPASVHTFDYTSQSHRCSFQQEDIGIMLCKEFFCEKIACQFPMKLAYAHYLIIGQDVPAIAQWRSN